MIRPPNLAREPRGSSDSDRPAFERATDLSHLGSGSYQVHLDEGWYQGRGAYGGLVAAILLGALELDEGGARPCRTLAVTFCAPATSGDATVTTSPIRRGGYVSHVRAELSRGDVVLASALATFARPRESVLAYADAAAPRLPEPREVADGPEPLYLPAFCQHFELRQALGPAPFSGGAEPRIGGWCRPRGATPSSAALFVALLDAWAPAALGCFERWAPAASVEMTTRFHIDDARDVDPSGGAWYAFEATSTVARDGYADERATLHAPDGRLLATADQVVALFA